MLYSRLFGKTVRDAKRGTTAISHKLLYRGGFIRELAAGRYELLPLGFRVFQKVIDLIDEEMNAIGSQRMSIPYLQPIEIWKKTNRDSAWGSALMKIEDARGAEFALSATGEGVVTEMVVDTAPTYKDLPIVVHQFIAKFRDETRPKSGLIRVREFVMKDAYSYNSTEEDFMVTYNAFKAAYSRICERLGLEYYPCIADSGALGGDYCHEFQIPCEAGEDHIVKCEKCDYAANVEKSEFVREISNAGEEMKEFQMVDLPYEVANMKQLQAHYNLPLDRFIKNVLYKASDGTLIIATVTGNLEVNSKKLEAIVGKGELELATDEDLASIGSKHGFLHSWGYDEHRDRIVYVVDIGVTQARNLYGGYKTDTQDPINVNYGRDFSADIVGDIAEPHDGATCSICGGTLRLIQTVEFGHIFKYDHFYTKHHDGFFIDKDGSRKLMYMGAYGIGVERAMAISVESHHDDKGIIWPKDIAPFDVHLVTIADKYVEEAAEIVKELESNGYEVLWDDREDVSIGAKFADADLIGNPIRLVLSDKSKQNGGIEIKRRDQSDSKIVSREALLDAIKELL